MPVYYIMIRRAAMPNSCFGGCSYRRIAVVEILNPESDPKKLLLSKRSSKIRILHIWEKLYSGKGVRDSFSRALAQAQNILEQLNQAVEG